MMVKTRVIARATKFALLLAVAIATAEAAHAQSQTLQVIAKGTIDPGCSVSVGTPFPAANLASSGSTSAAALVNCNKGFSVSAKSTNGLLKSSSIAPAGFTNSLAYSFAYSLPLDDSGSLTINCTSAQLAAGSGCSAGSSGKTAINKTASLQVSWTTPASPKLASGSYSDILTISVAAVP